MKNIKILNLLLVVVLFSLFSCKSSQQAARDVNIPKREFRGAWIQAVNGQFMGMSEEKMKSYLTEMLDNLQRANVNAIIFQVRVEGDALYSSPYEPWSRFLTGQQGKDPGWDPLAFMVREAHNRNMELHAWINPYRARTKSTYSVASTHRSKQKPNHFLEYAGQLYFNPAIAENREYICKIAADIVARYDVDGLHIDDYFYPYPSGGAEFPDEAFYKASGSKLSRGDWRRENVNKLIEDLFRTVRNTKPWVKFGVSPFGIYRNASAAYQEGSDTKGLQSYDELYADVLLWINNGWVDYCIPQIYWEIGHTAADYETLVGWWAKNASNRPLYIGQDVNRTIRAKDLTNPNVHQLPRKMQLQRSYSSVQGLCLWDAASAANNVGRYRDYLEQIYHPKPALMPLSSFVDSKAPEKVKGIKRIETTDGDALVWLTGEDDGDPMNAPHRYVVYRFAQKEKIDLDDASHIVTITANPYYLLPAGEEGKYVYVVTVLDRTQNESKGVKCKVKF